MTADETRRASRAAMARLRNADTPPGRRAAADELGAVLSDALLTGFAKSLARRYAERNPITPTPIVVLPDGSIDAGPFVATPDGYTRKDPLT